MKQFLDWLDHRTGYRQLMHEALYERIPGGARWRYVWGSTLVFTFVVQMITGFFLWSAYSPNAQGAWESVYYITEVMYLGNIVRGMHHFAAQAMVVLMALHLMQVIIDGAYKAPREINFWLGLILMQIVLGLSLTGYLLPWDQKGYYATKVSTNIASATPVIGEQVQHLVQGGPQYGHHTLTRFFALHAGLLPALLIGFLALHLYVFRRHGITVPNPDRAPTTTFWPDQVLRDAVACLAVLATVMVLAITKGAELSSPANPTENYRAARPEWYFLFLFRFLKFEWVEEHGLAFGAIYVPGILMAILFLMPIIALFKWGHRFNQAFAWAMCGIIIALTALAFYEDEHDADHQAAINRAQIEAERTVELAGYSKNMIPPEGAMTMLANDPLIQGAKIFKKNCSSCHHFNGLDGQNEKVMELGQDAEGNAVSVEAKPTAADLGNFGSREWMKSIITDYPNHFAPLKNAKWYAEAKQQVEAGESIDFIDPDMGEMAGWSKENGPKLLEPENKAALDAIVEYFVGNAIQSDAEGRQFNPQEYDQALAKKGEEILDQGMNSEGVLADASCFGCHAKTPDDEGGGYPTLVNYGSKEWLKSFLADPGTNRHYGDKNRMPKFEGRFTDQELDLLVRWMRNDYLPSELGSGKVQEPMLQTAPAE